MNGSDRRMFRLWLTLLFLAALPILLTVQLFLRIYRQFAR